MEKQPTLFEKIIPPCRHCGGSGSYQPAGRSSLGSAAPVERIECSGCTFKTKKMVHGHRRELLDCWVAGVPILVKHSYTRELLIGDDFYHRFPAWPKPVPLR